MSFCSWNNESPKTSHKVLQRQDARWLPSESIQGFVCAIFLSKSFYILAHSLGPLAWERSEYNMFPCLCSLGGCQTVENNCFQTPDYATIYSVSNQQNLQQCCGSCDWHLGFSYHLNSLLQLLSGSKKKKTLHSERVVFHPNLQGKTKRCKPGLYNLDSEAGNEKQTINWHDLLFCTTIIFSIFHCPRVHLSTALSSGSTNAVLQQSVFMQRKSSVLWLSQTQGVLHGPLGQRCWENLPSSSLLC